MKYFPDERQFSIVNIILPVGVDTEPNEEVYDDLHDIKCIDDGRNWMQKTKDRSVCGHLNKSIKRKKYVYLLH